LESKVTLTSNQNTVRGVSQAKSILVAIGGGKGGVGKSFISSNIGIFLANMGFNTVIVDLDLGAPNLHTCLGEEPPKANYHDFLSGRVDNITKVAVSTQFPKLRFISGANDHKELANITVIEQSRLMSALFHLDADFTILDLSAGTHTSTLDFFLMAHRHIVAITPDPTSIENAYRFMKASYFRYIKRYERQLNLETVVAELMQNQLKHGIRVPSDLMNILQQVEPQRGKDMQQVIQRLSYELVMNQTRGTKDVQLCTSIESVARKYFGLRVNTLGHIDYDNAVWNALRKRRPLLLEYPSSALYSQILAIARDLASPHLKKAVI
jgi:flagellar biosynthesis protein FlhG